MIGAETTNTFLMNPILRNILAFIGAAIIGSLVNAGLIAVGMSIIPIPAGIDPWDPESLKAGMELFELKHYITPFVAHAMGTLVGAFAVVKMAAKSKKRLAIGMGAFFLIGGIMNVFNLSFPTWFILLDLIVAYLPMGILGAKLAKADN